MPTHTIQVNVNNRIYQCEDTYEKCVDWYQRFMVALFDEMQIEGQGRLGRTEPTLIRIERFERFN